MTTRAFLIFSISLQLNFVLLVISWIDQFLYLNRKKSLYFYNYNYNFTVLLLINQLQFLTVFSTNFCFFFVFWLQFGIDLLRNFVSLEALGINNSNISAACINNVLCLAERPNLKTLWLPEVTIPKHIFEGIVKMAPNLRHIHIKPENQYYIEVRISNFSLEYY